MEEKNPLKAIEEFPAKQKLNYSLTEDAKTLTAELYASSKQQSVKPRKAVFNSAILAVASCLILVLFLFPFFNAPEVVEEPPRFFEDVNLTIDKVSNIDDFVLANKIKAHYYSNNELIGKSSAYYVENTSELVFLMQSGFILNGVDMDLAEVGIVLTKDRFEKFDSFTDLDKETSVQGITVKYFENLNNNETTIKAYFEKDHVRYFLKIIAKNPENKISAYVEALLA